MEPLALIDRQRHDQRHHEPTNDPVDVLADTEQMAIGEIQRASELMLAISGRRRPCAAVSHSRSPIQQRDIQRMSVYQEPLVDPDTRGDPEPPLRWCSKSCQKIASALVDAGHQISDRSAGKLL
jgi:hypothetical protein